MRLENRRNRCRKWLNLRKRLKKMRKRWSKRLR